MIPCTDSCQWQRDGLCTLDTCAAAVVAIASSYLDKPVPNGMAAVGEVGLSGEIRSVNQLENRISEVARICAS